MSTGWLYRQQPSSDSVNADAGNLQGHTFCRDGQIGEGVPSAAADVRLGDVVVSQPLGRHNGVVQYDMGKSLPGGFELTGSLNSPPHILLEAVAQIRASEMRGLSMLPQHMSRLERLERFQRDRAGAEILFDTDYDHQGGQTCELCDVKR